jgi:ABC-type transporter Mla subunit MlaD
VSRQTRELEQQRLRTKEAVSKVAVMCAKQKPAGASEGSTQQLRRLQKEIKSQDQKLADLRAQIDANANKERALMDEHTAQMAQLTEDYEKVQDVLKKEIVRLNEVLHDQVGAGGQHVVFFVR